MNYQEIFSRFQDNVFHFMSYYKYSFCFKGTLIGFAGNKTTVIVCCGGDKDDIYRASLKMSMTLREIAEQITIMGIEVEGEYYENE